jgi:hypothetical protein
MRNHLFGNIVQTWLLASLPLITAAIASCRTSKAASRVTLSEEPVPVYEEPRHHLVFQNSVVRVLDVGTPPGDTTAFHIHANRLIGVAVEDARTQTQLLGGPFGPIEVPGAVPDVFDNWDDTLPVTHRVANIDTVPIHYVVGEWLASPGLDDAPLPNDDMRHLVKEGHWGRAYRVTIPAHGMTTMHTHVSPGLTVIATAGVLVEEGDQPAVAGGSGIGRWSWRNPGDRHMLRNRGDKPLTIFEIDWR